MKDFSCPHCGKFVVRLDDTTAASFKLRCPNVACHRRLTLTKGSLFSSPSDVKADGAKDPLEVTDLAGHSLVELQRIGELRAKELLALTAYLQSQLEEFEAYVSRRRRSELRTENARIAVKRAANRVQVVNLNAKSDPEAVARGHLDDNLQAQRALLLRALSKQVERGRITPERAEDLVKKSNMLAGLNELAVALGMEELV